MRAVACNDCGHEFTPKLSESKSGPMYFRCPSCKRKYKVAKVTVAGRAIREQLAQIRSRVREASNRGDAVEAERLYREQLVMERELREHVMLYDNRGGKARVRTAP